MWGFLWLIGATTGAVILSGSLEEEEWVLWMVLDTFMALLGMLMCPLRLIVEGSLYGVSHVFSASMALLVPLWCLSLGPMREEGGWVLVAPAGTGEEEASCSTVGGGTSFRAHIPTQPSSFDARFQSRPYVEASLCASLSGL